MMTPLYNVVAKCGTYKDREGNKVQKWKKLGVSVDTREGGMALKLDLIPIDFDGWLYLAIPDDKNYID